MTTSEWIINISLVVVVLRQLQVTRIDAKFVVVPVVLVGISVASYLKGVPTAGNDLVMVGLFAAAGAFLGLAGGLVTRVLRVADGVAAQATFAAAAIWVVSMGSRIAFVEWATHGGGDTLTRFSMAHRITGDDAWVASFLALVVAEVGVRIATIVLRGRALARTDASLVALAA